MAKQDPNPPKWDPRMSDGCTGVLDKILWADFSKCCEEHDKAYHYGGKQQDKEKADKAFRDCCVKECSICGWVRWLGVKIFGGNAFNWRGPGSP